MARRVAIVTDSTAYLPPELAREQQIAVLPVQVIISGKPYLEGVDISTEQVASALREWKAVSTSRPSPASFATAYQQAADSGADSVVSAHLSSDLSGTYQMAMLAAKESPIPVQVVDSRTLAMALGYSVLTGADVADAGGSAEEVAAAVSARAARTKLLFYVDSLEYLRRGGRMGSAAAAFGGALRIKPILHVHDGRVQLLEEARTAAKALARLADLAVEAADGSGSERVVDVAVGHIDAGDRADQLADSLRKRLPGAVVMVGEIGAVVGTHVGPGMVSVVVAPRV
ncbi:MAG: DegV family protein [Actinomycetes bacterium]